MEGSFYTPESIPTNATDSKPLGLPLQHHFPRPTWGVSLSMSHWKDKQWETCVNTGVHMVLFFGPHRMDLPSRCIQWMWLEHPPVFGYRPSESLTPPRGEPQVISTPLPCPIPAVPIYVVVHNVSGLGQVQVIGSWNTQLLRMCHKLSVCGWNGNVNSTTHFHNYVHFEIETRNVLRRVQPPVLKTNYTADYFQEKQQTHIRFQSLEWEEGE